MKVILVCLGFFVVVRCCTYAVVTFSEEKVYVSFVLLFFSLDLATIFRVPFFKILPELYRVFVLVLPFRSSSCLSDAAVASLYLRDEDVRRYNLIRKYV